MDYLHRRIIRMIETHRERGNEDRARRLELYLEMIDESLGETCKEQLAQSEQVASEP